MRISVGLNVHVSAAPPASPFNEVVISALPTDARRLGPAQHVADVVSGYNLPHTRRITGTMAVDTSGSHRGRLYVTWVDLATGRGQILLRYSDDVGAGSVARP